MDLHYVSDWLNVVFRWAHVVFGAAWIGTSFYFNWLNNTLRPPEGASDLDAGVGGELWTVHGGHFYRVLKYQVAPEQLPRTLHWFKWEAYFTWITGACLLLVVYYLQANIYMVDTGVADITPLQAVGIGIGTLVGGWLIYHNICKTALVDRPRLFAAIMFAGVIGVAWGLSQLLNHRAAYIHVGALLGTCMALNVFFVIIPSQRVMVDAMLRGDEPDASNGRAGALRSLHNNYMTLPVLFIMVSNHFPMTYGSHWDWLVLAAIALIGVGTRHWFNLRGRGQRNGWLLPVSAAGILSLAFVMSPYASRLLHGATKARATPVTFAEANQIIVTRCTPCHSANPTFPGFAAPPKGIIFEQPAVIRARIPDIKRVAIDARIMPLGNLTHITDEERALLGQWIDEGAPLK